MSAKANVDPRTKKALLEEIEQLRTRLDEAEQTLDAIRSGEVDALVVAGPHGDQVFSLTGSERTYRLIIETMNEAALTVGTDETILFCNQRFCDLMKIPMQYATGQKITTFVPTAQQRSMRMLLDDVQTGPAKRRLTLRAIDGSPVSVQLAANLFVTDTQTSICLVASDLTELEAQAGSIRVLREQQQALEESKAELEATNTSLRNSRRSVLNVAEDAIVARRQTDEAIAELQRETAERKKAEEAVRQSEALYRSIGESIDYGVWVCAPDGRNLYASESFLKMAGITQEQCSDFGWGDVLHPDDSDRTIAAWQECVRTAGMWDIEHRFRGVDDQWHHVLARGVPIKNEQGEVTGWAGINLDIDRLKHVEENLRESEERLRRLGDNLPESAVYQYVHELNGSARFSYISEGIERLNGVTQEEVLQDASVLHRQFSPEFIERLIEAEAHSKRELKDFNMELPMHRPDGEVRWMQLRSRPRRMPDGRTVWDGVQTDITERKQAEELLRLSEERFRGLVEQAPVGIFVADAQGHYIDVNPAGTQMLGYTHEEICRMSFVDVLAPEEMAQIPEEVDRLADGKVHRHEWRFKRKDDSFFIGEVIGRQLPDGRLQGILRDMTEHKKAEAMLKDMNEELELRVADRTQELANSLNMLRVETNERLQATEALREKERMLIQQSRQAAMGEMIGNIAHQWRQPLNTLGLHAQRINLFYGSPNFNKEFLENSTAKTMEIIKHMSKTIDDFRNYFKPEKEKTVFKVIDAIKNTLSLLEGNFHNPPIAIDFVEHGNPVIKGYQNEFAQAFLNILNNARDAIIEWKITDPRIIITICSEESCAVVTVADNAGGIPDEIINKVFDPYFTTKGPQVGTGIGLFMSKTIIEKNMGGKLTVRNTDTGAEFRIEVEYGNQN